MTNSNTNKFKKLKKEKYIDDDKTSLSEDSINDE